MEENGSGAPPGAPPEQQWIPGTEPPKIKAIETLARRYVKQRDERMALLKAEVDTRDLLATKMREHGLKAYELEDGSTVEVCASEKIRVRRPKTEDE